MKEGRKEGRDGKGERMEGMVDGMEGMDRDGKEGMEWNGMEMDGRAGWWKGMEWNSGLNGKEAPVRHPGDPR